MKLPGQLIGGEEVKELLSKPHIIRQPLGQPVGGRQQRHQRTIFSTSVSRSKLELPRPDELDSDEDGEQAHERQHVPLQRNLAKPGNGLSARHRRGEAWTQEGVHRGSGDAKGVHGGERPVLDEGVVIRCRRPQRRNAAGSSRHRNLEGLLRQPFDRFPHTHGDSQDGAEPGGPQEGSPLTSASPRTRLPNTGEPRGQQNSATDGTERERGRTNESGRSLPRNKQPL